MKLSEGPRTLRLEAAAEGGYVVLGDGDERDLVRQLRLRFAGSLDECLGYLSANIAKHFDASREAYDTVCCEDVR